MEQASAAEHALTGEDGIADAAASLASVLEAAAELDPTADGGRAAGSRASPPRPPSSPGTSAPTASRSFPTPSDCRRSASGSPRSSSSSGSTAPPTPTSSAFLAEASERLRTLAGADDRIAELEAEARDRWRRSCGTAPPPSPSGRTAASRPLEDSVGQSSRSWGCPAPPSRSASITSDEPGPGGAERAELWFSPSPGQPVRAAREGRLRRRALPGHARVPERPRGSRRGGDPGVRRGRCGHRRPGRPGGGSTARPARGRPTGARRDPSAADRLLRRSGTSG